MRAKSLVLATLVLASFLCRVEAQTCVDPPSGMTSWWPLDETMGTTASDIVDANPGALISGPMFISGKVRNGLSFDGSDDYVLIPEKDTLDIDLVDFTIEFWVKASSTGGIQRPLISKAPVSGENYWNIRLVEDGRLFVELMGAGFVNNNFVVSTISIDDGSWKHIAIVRQGTTATIYIDGVIRGSGSTAGVTNINNPFNVLIATDLTVPSGTGIGFPFPGPRANFNGMLDEITFYKGAALTQTQVQDIYNANSAGKCRPQVITLNLPDNVVGQSSSHVIGTRLGIPPFTYSLVSGSPPPGMFLSSTGVVNGTPNAVGTFTFTVQVIDAGNASATGTVTKRVLATSPVCVPPPSGITSWWPLGETGGTLAADIVGTNTGTLANASMHIGGKVGNGLQFDGVNDSLIISESDTLDWDTIDFSMEFWLKAGSTGGIQRALISKSPVSGENYWNIRLVEDGRLFVELMGAGFINNNFVVSSISVNDGNWKHIAIVRQGTTVTIYIDGQVRGSGSSAGVTNTNNPFNVLVGTDSTVPGGPGSGFPFPGPRANFNGMLDEITFYKGTALTQTQVQAIYDAGTAGKCGPDANPPDTSTLSAVDGNGQSVTNGGSTTSGTITLTFSGTDDVGVVGFECRLDGGTFVACTSPQTFVGLVLGSHTFQVRARDAAGNLDPTPATFTWHVVIPQEQIGNVISNVAALVNAGVLNPGQGNALIAKLNAAIQKLNQGMPAPAINQLQAFVTQVNTWVMVGILTTAEGQALIDAINGVITSLGG